MASPKNLYYRQTIQRENYIKDFFLSFFLAFASYPRLLLEVFIRKDFGVRYFRLTSVITVAIILGLLPLIAGKFMIDPLAEEEAFAWSRYGSWYIFLAAFVVFSIIRKLEISHDSSIWEFKKYSLCSGKLHPVFEKEFPLFGIPNKRQIETILEPLPFLVAGIILWILHQPLGELLVICSVFYSLSYVGAYQKSTDFIMDRIDELIVNNAFESDFVTGAENAQINGFTMPGPRPLDPELRKKLLPLIMDSDADVVEVR